LVAPGDDHQLDLGHGCGQGLGQFKDGANAFAAAQQQQGRAVGVQPQL